MWSLVRFESRRRALLAGFAMAVAVWAAVPARAANIFEGVTSSPEFGIDPSIRSQAMGGASGAVFWGKSVNYWANPALLGLAEGITYENGTTEGLASDFNTDRWTLGRGGVGLATAGHPLGGLEFVIDPGLGFGPVSDEIHSWGIGLSASGIAASVARLRHRETPGFTRYADIAFGYNRKKLETSFPGLGVDESAVGVDWGVLARGSVPFHLGPGGIPARVEAGYSYSMQNSNDVSLTGTAGYAERPRRHGLAARFALDLPATWHDRLPAWLAPGFEPFISLGGAWDRQFIAIGNEPPRWDESHLGGELCLGNVAFVRIGNHSASSGDDRSGWGYGLGLPVGRLGGVQYDETRLGEIYGFPETTSHAWLVWVSPMEIARTLR